MDDESVKPSPLFSMRGDTGELEESESEEEEFSVDEEEKESQRSEEFVDSEETTPEPSHQQVSSASASSTHSSQFSDVEQDRPDFHLIKKALKRDAPLHVDFLPFNREKLKKPVLLHKPCESPPDELMFLAYQIGAREQPTNTKTNKRVHRLQDFALFWNDRAEKVRRVLNKYSNRNVP